VKQSATIVQQLSHTASFKWNSKTLLVERVCRH